MFKILLLIVIGFVVWGLIRAYQRSLSGGFWDGTASLAQGFFVTLKRRALHGDHGALYRRLSRMARPPGNVRRFEADIDLADAGQGPVRCSALPNSIAHLTHQRLRQLADIRLHGNLWCCQPSDDRCPGAFSLPIAQKGRQDFLLTKVLASRLELSGARSVPSA